MPRWGEMVDRGEAITGYVVFPGLVQDYGIQTLDIYRGHKGVEFLPRRGFPSSSVL